MNNKIDEDPFRVSVVVNIWGKDDPALLVRSLESIRRQSFIPTEVLVVIDGLISDKIEIIINEFVENSDFSVRLIRIKNAKGLWNARNEGLRSATGNYVALHDADDVMHPDRLGLLIKELNISAVDVLCTPAWEFDVNSGKILKLRVCSKEMIDIHSMFWNNPINHSSVIARRETLIELGGYRNVFLSEDYDLWLRMVIAGKTIRQSRYVLQALGINGTFLARRGGSKFLSAEKSLHKLFQHTGSFSTMILWVRLMVRLSYRIGPLQLREAHKKIKKNKLIVTKPLSIDVYLKNDPVDTGLDYE
jgi:glycosyltransferase involved in cell wall biosynthesis